MIRVFYADGGRSFAAEACAPISTDFVWLDLIRPSAEEEKALEKQLKIELPSAEEMRDIEPSSRLYREGEAAYMTANVVWRAATEEPESAPISFILSASRLITIRYSDPRPFVAFAAYVQKNAEPCRSGRHAMVGLVEAIVDRTAEILEGSGAEIDAVSRTVFRLKQPNAAAPVTSEALRELLARVALNQNLVAKARESLVSLGRMMSFFSATQDLNGDLELREHVRSVGRDIQSLTDHASFLTSNTTFLQDAALGLINLQQNEIIKIFSVAAVMFLPPTMVASIYGMNFDVMPELKWAMGYPFSLVLMALSALLPFLYFKRRGWL